ncbi:MAG: trigger factor [Gammaproteobacteria bacterium]|nr:trigger factor [Gammaproteobacteria bacterium]
MQVSVETTNGLERKITVAVDEERISNVVDGRLQDMTKTVSVKGFRKGKVPLKVVKQQYEQQVRQEVVGDVLQSTLYEAIGQEKLQPAGQPRIDSIKSDPGQGIEYTALFEVYPEVTLGDLSKETVEKPVAEISDADVEDMLETVRKQHKEWVTADRAAQDGDQLTISFKGMIDGEAFPGGEANDMPIELGSGRMIKGFEEGLLGAKAGDDVTLNVTFPDDYHAKELAGKPAQFDTHVNKVEEAQLPEINDDFAKMLGIKDASVENMHKEIKASMQQELEQRLNTKLKSSVMDALINTTDFDVPTPLIQEESEAIKNNMLENFKQQGMQDNSMQLDASMFADQAERRVKLGLIMNEIVQSEGIKTEKERVQKKIEEIAAPYEQPQQVIDWYNGDKQRLAEVQALVTEEKVVEWVMEKAKVVDKTMTFKEVMNAEANK